ncbi:MAG: NAD(P)-dependent oxidoreductase, partial [Acidobacteria bacterium ACB2]|nr:NAD(P)-dependent oxidoreductase [Acidobacteria bacterium ACB2]
VEEAAEGSLVVLAGGDEPALEKSRPVLDAVSRLVERFGPVGQGSAMKLVDNLAFLAGLVGFAEALALAERTGIGAERAAAFLFGSPLVAPYLKVKYDFVAGPAEPARFSISLAEKDVRLAAETGGRSLPTAGAVHGVLEAAKAAGFAGADVGHALTFVLGRRPSPE